MIYYTINYYDLSLSLYIYIYIYMCMYIYIYIYIYICVYPTIDRAANKSYCDVAAGACLDVYPPTSRETSPYRLQSLEAFILEPCHFSPRKFSNKALVRSTGITTPFEINNAFVPLCLEYTPRSTLASDAQHACVTFV